MIASRNFCAYCRWEFPATNGANPKKFPPTQEPERTKPDLTGLIDLFNSIPKGHDDDDDRPMVTNPPPPPVITPPLTPPPPPPVASPPPPPTFQRPHLPKNTGKYVKKSAKLMGKVAIKGLKAMIKGAGIAKEKVAAYREERRQRAAEAPPREPRPARRKAAPAADPVAAKLDPRLAAIPDETMIQVFILGDPNGTSVEESRASLGSLSIAPGNERNALRKTAAKRNLKSVLDQLQKERAAHPGDVLAYELNWLLNGVVVAARARLARALARLGAVNYVSLDDPVTLSVPRAPRPASAGEGNWGAEKIQAPQVWKDFGVRGQGVTIGIVDSGVDGSHKDLAGRVVRFRDFTKVGAPDMPSFDDCGHGTHCAGIIAGGSDGSPPIGVAPQARLLVAKTLDKDGKGSVQTVLQALQWMADPDDNPATRDQPTAVSLSLGMPPDAAVNNKLLLEAIARLREAGVVAVFASGNSGVGKVPAPSVYPFVLAVGATKADDQVSDFTSRGNVTLNGASYVKPDISAPGEDIYSTVPGNRYEKKDGTSQAAPHVAGVVALMKSANPELTAEQIESILKASVADLGPPGPDADFGRGRINAHTAVEMARRGLPGAATAAGAAPSASPAAPPAGPR